MKYSYNVNICIFSTEMIDLFKYIKYHCNCHLVSNLMTPKIIRCQAPISWRRACPSRIKLIIGWRVGRKKYQLTKFKIWRLCVKRFLFTKTNLTHFNLTICLTATKVTCFFETSALGL